VTKLWGKLWFRIVAALVAGPIVMTLTALATLFFYVLVIQRGRGDFSDILPSPGIFAGLLGVSCVMILPPLVAVEIVNRRRTPLPPGLCAAFLALLAAFSMIGLMAAVQISQRLTYTGSWQFGVAVLTGCYLGASFVSLAIVSPFIRRWRQRSATVAEIAERF